MSDGWVGVDFDGTLAKYEHWGAPDALGEPIQPMVDLIKGLLSRGIQVKIFTARAFHDFKPENVADALKACKAIQAWCLIHLGQELEITCVKDYHMIELIDDRAVQVEMNTGRLIGHSTRGLF